MDAWLGVRVLNQAPRLPTKPPLFLVRVLSVNWH
jgi:hypothetical protein